MTNFDLKCQSGNFIAFFSMAYFIGFTISGVVTPTLVDTLGRKYVFLIGRLITFLCFIVIAVLPQSPDNFNNTYIIQGMIMIVGLLACSQSIAGYNLFCEYTTVATQSDLGTIWNCMEGVE